MNRKWMVGVGVIAVSLLVGIPMLIGGEPGVARPSTDPVETNPTKYSTVFENDRVRVLDYRDHPGEKTTPHAHPDSVIYAMEPFKRRLTLGNGKTVVIEMKEGQANFIPAQSHVGENIGTADTHVVIVELKK